MQNIEKNLIELSEILEKMQEASLQESLTLYAEGVQLAEACLAAIQSSEDSVLQLKKTSDAMFEVVKFGASK